MPVNLTPVYWALRGVRADGDPTPAYWGPKQGDDAWTDADRAAFGSIPTGATWVCGLCGQGNPTAPDHICR